MLTREDYLDAKDEFYQQLKEVLYASLGYSDEQKVEGVSPKDRVPLPVLNKHFANAEAQLEVITKYAEESGDEEALETADRYANNMDVIRGKVQLINDIYGPGSSSRRTSSSTRVSGQSLIINPHVTGSGSASAFFSLPSYSDQVTSSRSGTGGSVRGRRATRGRGRKRKGTAGRKRKGKGKGRRGSKK